MKISTGILKPLGHSRGKFHKLIAIHSKLLSALNHSNIQKPE